MTDHRQVKLNKLLIDALMNSTMSLLKKRLDQGASPDSQGDDGERALCLACQTDKVNEAKLLLERKANPLARSRDGRTPLMRAATEHNELFELLLPLSDIHARDQDGANAWHFFCQLSPYRQHPSDEILQERAKALAPAIDPLFVDNRGSTCLDLAIRSRRPFLIQACLDAGGFCAQRAIHPALLLGKIQDLPERQRLQELLLTRFPPSAQQAELDLLDEVESGHDVELCKLLLPLAAPGSLPKLLIHAAQAPNEVLRWALSLGDPQGVADERGSTLLMLAIEARKPLNAMLLLPRAEVEARDAIGEDALEKTRDLGFDELGRAIEARLEALAQARELELCSRLAPSSSPAAL